MSKSVINLPAPFGGMNNVLPADKIGNNQAVLIENVEYDDNLKTFKGSNKFKDLTYNYGKFNKLYEVIIDNTKHLIITHDNGYFDVTLNKNFPLGISIDNVVSNEDGLYFSSGSKVYEYKDGVLKEIYSQTFKSNIQLDTLDKTITSMAYYNGELYFTSGNSVYIRYYDEVEEKHKLKLFFTIPDNSNNMQVYLFKSGDKLYLFSCLVFRVENNESSYNAGSPANFIKNNMHRFFHGGGIFYYGSKEKSFLYKYFNGIDTMEYLSSDEAINKVLNNNLTKLYVFDTGTFKSYTISSFVDNYNNCYKSLKSSNHDTTYEIINHNSDGNTTSIKAMNDYITITKPENEVNKPFMFTVPIYLSYYNSNAIILHSVGNNNTSTFKDMDNKTISSYMPELDKNTYIHKIYIFDIKHPLGKSYKVYFVLKFKCYEFFFEIVLDVLYRESDNDSYKVLLENYILKHIIFFKETTTSKKYYVPAHMHNDYVNIIKVSDYEFIIVKDCNFIYCSFFKNLSSTDIVFKYNNIMDNHLETNYDYFYLSTYSKDENIIYNVDVRNNKLYKFSTSLFSKKIPFLLIHNGRLIVPNEKSLYFSAVGDFSNFSTGTDADGLYLEIGYKDGGNLIAGAISYGNIILFKDNGYVYRLSGDYPNWVLTKIAETDTITSNIFNYNGSLLFGTTTGIKQLNPSQNYGDFTISDFQNNIISDNVTHISLSENRKALIFCSENYVIEYSLLLNIFYIYQSKVYKEILEYYDKEKKYTEYAVDSLGKVYNNKSDEKNIITINRGLISYQKNIVIKSITLFTDVLKEDEEITIYLHGDINFKRVLKQGQSKHKIFLTKRLLEMQLKYIHTGNIFINNIIVECDLIGV